jgi:integrase
MITIKAIQSLAPGSTLWDEATPGFGVRRQAKAAVFFLKYRVGGKQVLYTIGRFGALTPDQARREARRILGSVASGGDPQRQKISARSGTMLRTINDYLARAEKRLRPRSFVEVRRHLLGDWQCLHRLSVASVTRNDVATGLEAIEERGATAAVKARETLSAMFKWAIGRGLCENNPVTGTIRPKTRSRERVLSKDELARLWHNLDSGRFSDIVRLLVLSGQRRSEIGGLRWDEVTGDNIVLPPTRTKNARVHVVPLSPLARDIINRQDRASEFVFGFAPFSGWSKPKAALDRRLGIADWTLHDLRRTFATLATELGFAPPHVIESALNHYSGHRAGIVGVYQRSTYSTEVRAALDRWSEYVAGL